MKYFELLICAVLLCVSTLSVQAEDITAEKLSSNSPNQSGTSDVVPVSNASNDCLQPELCGKDKESFIETVFGRLSMRSEKNIPNEKATVFFSSGGKKAKRIARTVFFNAETFSFAQISVGGVLSFESGVLGNIAHALKDEVSFGLFIQGNSETPDGFWLILFGKEDAVEELYTVFKEIANANTTPPNVAELK